MFSIEIYNRDSPKSADRKPASGLFMRFFCLALGILLIAAADVYVLDHALQRRLMNMDWTLGSIRSALANFGR